MAASAKYNIITEPLNDEVDIEAITAAQESNKISAEFGNRTNGEGEMIATKKFVTFRESGAPTLNLPEALLNATAISGYSAEYDEMTSHGEKSELQIVKPLKMEIGVGKSPVQFHPVLGQIEELSDGRLWLFDKLTICPPTSQLKERLFPDKKRSKDLNVFIAPNPNELRELATGADGSLKRLNDEQHIEIRQKGTFSVPSKNFPGAVHSWKITQLLQRGNEPANDDFRGLLARAYYFTFIIASNRVTGRVLSMRDAIENIGYAAYFVYNSLIGGRIRNPNYNLEVEMFQKLTEDLRVADPNQLKSFAKKMLQLYKSFNANLTNSTTLYSLPLSTERRRELENKAPNLYSHTNGDKINLFAVSPSWIGVREEKTFATVAELVKSNYPPRRVQRLIKEHRDDGMTDNEIIETIQRAFDAEYLTTLISSLRENASRSLTFPEKEDEVIETYLRGLSIIREELMNEEERMRTFLNDTHDSLVERHTIRSKCNEWLTEKVEEARKVAERNENSFQNVIQKLGENEAIGPEWRYFIQRAEEFHNSLPETIARLSKNNYTTVKSNFRKMIWKPTNYIVTHVKTRKRKTDIQMVEETTHNRNNPHLFSMTKKQVITVTSEYAGWRWRKYFVSFYTWFLNFLFILLVGMVLKGPFSLSALFLWYKYPTNYELDYTTGNVYPNQFGNTFVTLLRSLWSNIMKRRMIFEQKPDTGFLPKNMTRLLNRFYLYVIYGFFGTIIFSFVFPATCLVLIATGIVLVITIPIWYVALSIIIILFRTLIYDFQYEDGTYRNPGGKAFPLFYLVIYKLGVRVILQLLVSLLIIILMPVFSLVTILIACLRRSLRFMWDFFMYVVIIKPRGRVPITNSFVARRISGPGLATNYYYQIHPSQALIKFEYDLEGLELNLYQNFMMALLNQPSNTYSKFINNVLAPLGYHGGTESTNKSVGRISSQKHQLGEILNNKMKERGDDFSLDSPTVSVDKIRMIKKDLDSTIRIATQIIEEFYTKRILVYPAEDKEDLFSSKGLETNDWEGLAKIQLNSSFSPSFLAPLEESDESFYLHVEKLGLDDYFEALSSGLTSHDLDRERMITVDKQYTFLPGIHLTPTFDLNWARNNCLNYSRRGYGRVKRSRANVTMFLTSDFNNKLTFAEKLATRVGWENILGDDEEVNGDAAATEV